MFAHEQQQRIALQNKLIELNGNIRVHCKIRPVLGDAAVEPEVRAQDKSAVEIRVQGSWRQFEYDRCYLPGETSDDVFAEVAPLVASFVDGYNVCILAYGQTGSGKTHTMLGPSNDDGVQELVGVIPQTTRELFRLADGQVDRATFTITVSIMEVGVERSLPLLPPSFARSLPSWILLPWDGALPRRDRLL